MAGVIAASIMATEAAAQGELDVRLEEIVVTAQRREQSLQDVPISLSVVAGETLDREAIYTLDDLTSRLPSVKFAETGSGDRINIRGIDSGSNLGFEQAVATFVDGAYRGRSRTARLAFFDVERIEVLRGPQTTFFGNNAIAGAFNITTRKPSDRLEWNAGALYSPSDGEYGIEGGVSVPLSETFSMRVAAKKHGMDGYIDNNNLDRDGPDLDGTMGRVSLLWKPIDRLRIDARFDYGRFRDTDMYSTELLNCPAGDPFPTAGACARYLDASGGTVDDKLDHEASTGPSSMDYDFFESAVTVGYEFENHRLTAISTYSDQDFDYLSSLIPTPNSSLVGTVNGLPHRSQEEVEQYSQEIRLESTGDRKIDYMVGAYYLHNKVKVPTSTGYYFIPFGLLVPGGIFAPDDRVADLNLNREKAETLSAFASATVHFTPDLRFNAGMRYSRVKKRASRNTRIGLSNEDLTTFTPVSAQAQAIVAGFLGFDLTPFEDPTRRDSKFMPSASVEFDLLDDVMAYASYTRGFKAGGFGVGTSNTTFEPETVDAYEIGLKSSFLDRRLTVNLAAFLSKYDDMQEATFVILQTGIPKGTIANVAESTAKGIELGGAWQISRSLLATLDVAYLKSEYDSYPLAPCTALQNLQPNCVQDMSGKRRGLSPKFSGAMGLNYTTAITDRLNLRLGTSIYHSSEYFTSSTADPLTIQSDYTKIDARIALASSENTWELALIGNNLTDETISNVRIDVPTSNGSKQALAERPQSYAVQFLIRY
jgi:outer membrane receptor protein involved in Fe transport